MPTAISTSRRSRGTLLGAALAVTGLLGAACGGQPPVAQPDTTPSLSGNDTILTVEDSANYGTVLTDGLGRSLYLFTAETRGQPTCYERCAQVWQPFVAEGQPQPEDTQNATVEKQMGTVTRRNGTVQVSYNGHPLYYYRGDDNEPARTDGQAVQQFGGTWFLLNPLGRPVPAS